MARQKTPRHLFRKAQCPRLHYSGRASVTSTAVRPGTLPERLKRKLRQYYPKNEHAVSKKLSVLKNGSIQRPAITPCYLSLNPPTKH